MANITSKPTTREYRENYDRVFSKGHDEELAQFVEDVESGKIKPTDPDWVDAPEACTPQAPMCEDLVDVDVGKYPTWPVRLPKAVYAYLEIVMARASAAKEIGDVAAYVQFESVRDRSWCELSPAEQKRVEGLLGGWREPLYAKTKRDVNKMECACGGTEFKETTRKDGDKPVYECVACGTLCVD